MFALQPKPASNHAPISPDDIKPFNAKLADIVSNEYISYMST